MWYNREKEVSMSYVGSYMWQLRQKAGDMRILTVTVDAVVANEKGEVKLVYAPHVNGWASVGGHAEYGDTWQTAALHELEEEAGIIAREEDLEPFAAMSGTRSGSFIIRTGRHNHLRCALWCGRGRRRSSRQIRRRFRRRNG